MSSGSDERVEVTTDTIPRRYVHDESGRLIGEYGATGTVHAEHVWLMPDTEEGGWEPLALLGPTSVSYVHGDHLGVCPNCHRQMHLAATSADERKLLGRIQSRQ
jgi:hypothetical protein